MITNLEQIREDLYKKIQEDDRDLEGLFEMIKSLTFDGKEPLDKAAAECVMGFHKKLERLYEKTKVYKEWFGDDEEINRLHDLSKKSIENCKGTYENITGKIIGDELNIIL